jgi:S1-C subfamily serine protease
VTGIDWVIVAFTALLAMHGARQGFVVGALSLAGFGVGAVLGTRLAPAVLPEGAHSPYAPLLGLLGALLAGAVLATGLGGLGARVRTALTFAGLRLADAALGAVLSAAVALAIAWLAGAAALQSSGRPALRHDVQRSAVLTRLNDVLPPSGSILHALARFDPLPAFNGPNADVPAPTAAIARRPGVRAAATSVVRVLGTACGLGVEGSGWVVGRGLVVTNAHVVAGQDDTAVQAQGSGPHLSAQAVAYDARNDIAILRVPGLDAPALRLASDAPSGTAAAILGFPENGPYDVRAARIGATTAAVSQDAYGRGPVLRRLVPIRGLVRHGNSGGPVVDAQGRVLATVFAATVSTRRHGGFGVPDDIVRKDLDGAAHAADTGPCATG